MVKGCVFTVVLFCFLCDVSAQTKKVTANDFFNGALRKSALEKKPLLLLCYGNLNPWSPVLDSLISSKPISDILSRYYVVKKLKVKENGWAAKRAELIGADLLFDQLYSKDSAAVSVPAIFIVNKSGNKLGQYSGFPENIDDFINILVKSSIITNVEQNTIKSAIDAFYKRNGVLTAQEELNNAVAEAKNTHKKVFLIFHASWCHWCHVLDTAMNEQSCKALFEKKFVIAHIVAHESTQYLKSQNLGADAMLARYQGPKRNGIPFWVIFDENGNKLADFNGFPSPHYAEDYAAFENILREIGGFSETELAKVKNAFSDLSVRNGIRE